MNTMTQTWADDVNGPSTSSSNSYFSSHPVCSQLPTSSCALQRGTGNVFRLLAWREISSRSKLTSKRLGAGTSKCNPGTNEQCYQTSNLKSGLISWAEAKSLRHLSAKYCPLVPPPRSTIAAAFSPDGKTLASTHGDHTVKIINCQTGRCLKVLSGHRRTPWVVRFHPLHPEILASGSLDHEVRLWDATTSECIGSRDFCRPIASIAFHAQGELLAVASGHKLYMWHYNRRGDTSSPAIVLKTRRSLRAVHFHPYASPFLLTAEVNDLDSPDSPMTLAASSGYLHYPPPVVFFANIPSNVSSSLEGRVPLMPFSYLFWPTYLRHFRRHIHQLGFRANSSPSEQRDDNYTSSGHPQLESDEPSQHTHVVTPMDVTPEIQEVTYNYLSTNMDAYVSDSGMDTRETVATQHGAAGSTLISESTAASSGTLFTFQPGRDVPNTPRLRQDANLPPNGHPSNISSDLNFQMLMRSVGDGQFRQSSPFSDPTCWELPFFQGWLVGQTHSGLQPMVPLMAGSSQENLSGVRDSESDVPTARDDEAMPISSSLAAGSLQTRNSGRSGPRHRSRGRIIGSAEGSLFGNFRSDDADFQSGAGRIEMELATSLAAVATAESPCTVRLRIWPFDIQNPCALLDADSCLLTIPHAVLCSEMGAHFSPCGRFLAVCVACVLPHVEAEVGLNTQPQQEVNGATTSPTRHPISAHQIIYELRIYSLEKATFGVVLSSRAIRAAHCLTSIQFSPTSEHILLSYGRRHISLLRSIVVDGETTIPIYTILEVYRVSDMELVKVLPSSEDEVNVACFHPLVGEGLVYGTKEGKLRFLQHDGSHGANAAGPYSFLEENMLERWRLHLNHVVSELNGKTSPALWTVCIS